VRTTLDIADDVLLAVKERARRERRSAGDVISDLARQALQARVHSDTIAESDSFYGFRPLPRRGGTVSNELIARLLEEED
jgi:hypothetical protein